MSRPAPAEAVGYLELLSGNRNYRYLWFGQIISLLGDWFNLIASATLISMLTQSGAAVGGLFVVRMLAPFLISPIAGVVADRYNRKWLLIATDIVRGVTVLGFLFVRSPEDVWLVYVLSAIQMGISGFFFPTKNAILPDVTTRAELGAANALSSATWSVMLALGAALGGLASGILGPYPAFILDALTFFLSAVFIAQVAYQQPAALDDADTSIMAGLRQYIDGLNYLRHNIDILMIATLKAWNALMIAGGFQVAQVAIAEQVFPIGEGGGISLGLMYMAVGIGTGLGPIVVRQFTGDRDRALRLTIIAAFATSAVGLFTVSTLINFPLVLFGTFLRGLGAGTMWVFTTQLLLQLLPDDVRGRVFSSEFAMWTLMNAAGAATIGGLLDTGMDVGNVVRLMGFGTLIPVLVWGAWVFFGPRPKRKVTVS